ncbi:hypothetical protein [Occallatibacter riparius]|uniref:Uncharacterized protein n=1 Tax=Occallatibacter riparius TaxID=1002689 RepID=A0A9J7BUH1_9BACT|nr:hypothetical protein [Occallatibacter riparius]UWZ86524.1 hypothetical protein MOP44_11390 [Occallatibacter riparius]
MRKQLHSCRVALVIAFVLMGSTLTQAKSKYICDEPQPADLCTAANTCGSASESCKIDIRRSGGGASVKPGVPNAKSNQFFCVKAGTEVVWMTSSKNTGFSVYFGTDSPFTPDDPIVGGGSKPVTVKAQTPGCYKYDAGAFYSGAVFGMSGGSKPELVILP